MRWSSFWLERARGKAKRRRQRYAQDPPAAVASILTRGSGVQLRRRERARLMRYVLWRSPRSRWRLFWDHLRDRDTPARERQVERLAVELRSRVSAAAKIRRGYFERRNYSRDLATVPAWMERMLHRTTPLLVLQPGSEEDLVAALVFAAERGLGVFPRGSASSAFGGAVPTRNGIVVDFSPMDRVLKVDAEAARVRVQPGVRWADLRRRLEPLGLAPRTTPTSLFSTVAGWLATGGFGLGSLRYGHLGEAIEELRVVRASGRVQVLRGGTRALAECLGTEGQFGLISEVTLRLRRRSGFSRAALLLFDHLEAALTFVSPVARGADSASSTAATGGAEAGGDTTRATGGAEAGGGATHALLLNRARLRTENTLQRDRLPQLDPFLPEQDALLLHFDDAAAWERFLARLTAAQREQIESNATAAAFLWAERYFPLKKQRIGPGLLGAEVLLPAAATANYLQRVADLTARTGIDPAIEVVICRREETPRHLVMSAMSCDPSRGFHYLLRLLLVQLLNQAGVDVGGRPYGIGIWNTPFFPAAFSAERRRELQQRKAALDPHNRVNPGKFFGLQGRFFGLSALPMRPRLFRATLRAARRALPLIGWAMRRSEPPRLQGWDPPPRERDAGRDLLLETAARCTSCGACLPTCPAYRISGDELVTGRAKLRLAQTLLSGPENPPVNRAEAHSAMQCIRCGLCEEVCQTRLPLREAYLALEERIEARFGPATESVSRFIREVDAERARLLDTYGLDLAEWRPGSEEGGSHE
jgi:FAD/FMN-containing dehydrogenase/ferredoxin